MKYYYIYILWLICAAALVGGCTPVPQNNGEDEPGYEGELIETVYEEKRNMTLDLLDITGAFNEVCYRNYAVPVKHTTFGNLPDGLKPKVKSFGISGQTAVFRMKWKGETVYHLMNIYYLEYICVYKASGENIRFESSAEYAQFLKDVTDVTCLLIIDPKVVKNAAGAPNLLVGTWQTDWTHLHHVDDTSVDFSDDQVTLYNELPFNITEVSHFNADGTGYLRTVKTFKNGDKEVALDPFTYYLTDYNTSGSYSGYYYVCCYAAGDTIEYTARSRNGFERTSDHLFVFVTYPWYKKGSDPYAGEDGSPKYRTPSKNSKSLIEGRWTGTRTCAIPIFGIFQNTWVFRSDGTGYLLDNKLFSESFVYTVEGSGPEYQLTIYKYDTGFTADDGFWAEDDLSYTYVPSPTPKGLTMKARIYQDGDRLELEGGFNENRAADGSKSPVVYKRQ